MYPPIRRRTLKCLKLNRIFEFSVDNKFMPFDKPNFKTRHCCVNQVSFIPQKQLLRFS